MVSVVEARQQLETAKSQAETQRAAVEAQQYQQQALTRAQLQQQTPMSSVQFGQQQAQQQTQFTEKKKGALAKIGEFVKGLAPYEKQVSVAEAQMRAAARRRDLLQRAYEGSGLPSSGNFSREEMNLYSETKQKYEDLRASHERGAIREAFSEMAAKGGYVAPVLTMQDIQNLSWGKDELGRTTMSLPENISLVPLPETPEIAEGYANVSFGSPVAGLPEVGARIIPQPSIPSPIPNVPGLPQPSRELPYFDQTRAPTPSIMVPIMKELGDLHTMQLTQEQLQAQKPGWQKWGEEKLYGADPETGRTEETITTQIRDTVLQKIQEGGGYPVIYDGKKWSIDNRGQLIASYELPFGLEPSQARYQGEEFAVPYAHMWAMKQLQEKGYNWQDVPSPIPDALKGKVWEPEMGKATEKFVETVKGIPAPDWLVGMVAELPKWIFFSPAMATGTVSQQDYSLRYAEEQAKMKSGEAVTGIRISTTQTHREALAKILKIYGKNSKEWDVAKKVFEEAIGKSGARNLIKDVIAQEGFYIPPPSKPIVDFVLPTARLPTEVGALFTDYPSIVQEGGKAESEFVGKEPSPWLDDINLEDYGKLPTPFESRMAKVFVPGVGVAFGLPEVSGFFQPSKSESFFKSLSEETSLLKSTQQTALETRQSQIAKQEAQQREKMKYGQMIGTGLASTFLQRQVTRQVTRQPTITTTTGLIPRPRPPRRPPIGAWWFPGAAGEAVRKPRRRVTPKPSAFEVFVKRRGREVRVSPFALRRREAIALGVRETKRGAAAQFFLKPTKKKARRIGLRVSPKTLAEFRKPIRKGKEIKDPLKFVQRRPFRIMTAGEKRQITYLGIEASKRRKPKKKRRKKR